MKEINASDDEENWDEVMFYLQEYSTLKSLIRVNNLEMNSTLIFDVNHLF
jgi:hypothetical protein